MDLFRDSDCEQELNQLKINQDFAAYYEKTRAAEELQRLKDKYGDVDLKKDISNTDSESSETDSELETDDLDFYKTLSALKTRDPKLYDNSSTFFEPSKDQSLKKQKQEKPMFLKDYERETVLSGGQFNEDEINSDDEKAHSPTYMQEQKAIKDSFKFALIESDNEDEHLTQNLLRKKEKTLLEEEKEESDFKTWLTTQDKSEQLEKENADLSGLKKYWNKSDLEESEKFLKDFLLSKQYCAPTETSDDDQTSAVLDSEEEDEAMDRIDDFESKFNFRFEEPNSDVIKSYPRTINETIRQEKQSRKQKRESREKRKKEEKQKVVEELTLLKDLKQKELLTKIEQLKKVAGNYNDIISNEYLDQDFNPQEHDEMLAKMFNQDYYENGKEEEYKPEVPKDIESAYEEFADENLDDWVATDSQLPEEEDVSEINAFLESERERVSSRKEKRQKEKEKKKSLFMQALDKKKPIFDPKAKTFEEYVDDYYKLNFENVIGKTPVRFKYRNVLPNSFGLSVDEILGSKDKELNQWASIKKVSQYRTDEEEKYDLKAFEAKGQNIFKKSQVLKSLFETEETEKTVETEEKIKETKATTYETSSNSVPSEVSAVVIADKVPLTKRKKRQRPTEKTPCKKVKLDSVSVNDSLKTSDITDSKESKINTKRDNVSETSIKAVTSKKIITKKSKKIKNKSNGDEETKERKSVNFISDVRIGTFGMNPKKFKRFKKYGKKSKE